MKVSCTECGGKASIRSRDNVSPLFSKLYCLCLDAKCGHGFVMHLSFSHTLRPSGNGLSALLFDRLRSLPEEERHALFERVSADRQRAEAGM
ncbi:MAG TPA: ogr/Delta-like zinc finger family protein [Pseudomonas sp.]|nr:ogr/Delta-like zinc finger family protein [Pseudomonas sp.]